MSSSFDTPIDRRADSNSVKWHLYPEDVLPMWVADMDFKSPDAVVQALADRVAHGVFGYEWPKSELCGAIVSWCDRQYGWKITPEDIVYLPGLVSGLNLVCRSFGHMGDGVAMLTPVYPPFLTAPINQGMTAEKCRLVQHHHGNRVSFEVDFDALERAITPRTTMFMHCHPHNPIGHEFTESENRKLGELCVKHDLIICADEIHCDLMLDGRKHVPMAALDPAIADRCVTLMAPSKTFNVPGLGFSFAVVQNAALRKRMQNAETGIVPHVNSLGQVAALAAYTRSDAWHAELLGYLSANRDTLVDYVDRHLPGVRTTMPDSTYLGFLDCRDLGLDGTPYSYFLREAKVAFNDGATFGPGGQGFIRVNFGCTRAQLITALDRVRDALERRGADRSPVDSEG